jgi:4-hydroxybenzoate polyprenyltransferase
LVVFLEGTLLRSGVLAEEFLALFSRAPLQAIAALWRLCSGIAPFRALLAREAKLDVASLPWNENVVGLLKRERNNGRSLYLVSAADRRQVESIARHFGLFDGIFASDGKVHLNRRAQIAMLCRTFGEGHFDLIARGKNSAIWARDRVTLKTYLKAIRIHQWLKNTLLFVPLLAAKRFEIHTIENCLMAFLSFSLCASSVYLMNDLVDLERDRAHSTKRRRPFAAGLLPVSQGLVVVPVLLAISGLIANFVGPAFFAILAIYCVTNAAYSLTLKRQMVIDVVTLACLYGLRLIAGSVVAGVPLSQWLVTFAVFIFTSLALVKRCAELNGKIAGGGGDPLGRGYRLDDLSMLKVLAASTGMASILVFVLYLNSSAVSALYVHPKRLSTIAVVLIYWVGRILLLVHRGEMKEDPVVFAATDRASYFCFAVVFAVALAASL